MKKEIIKHNSKLYIFEQDVYEPDNLFYERIWFVINGISESTTKKEFDILVKKSRIMNNIKYLEASYTFISQN